MNLKNEKVGEKEIILFANGVGRCLHGYASYLWLVETKDQLDSHVSTDPISWIQSLLSSSIFRVQGLPTWYPTSKLNSLFHKHLVHHQQPI